MATVRVTDYGAVGDGSTDNLTAIRNAIAALSNGDTLDFNRGGVYGYTSGGGTEAFLLDGLDDIKVSFAGSQIKRLSEDFAGVGAHNSILCTNGRYTLLRPSLDGNRHEIESATTGGYGGIDDDTNGLCIGEGCDAVVVEDLTSVREIGAGLKLTGENGNHLSGGRVDRPDIRDFLGSGIWIDRGVDDVAIRQPGIVAAEDSGSCIDAQPTGLGSGDAPTGIRIYGGSRLIDGSATTARAIIVGGSDTSDRVSDWYLDGLRVLGDVQTTNATYVRWLNCDIVGSSQVRACFDARGTSSNLLAYSNSLDNSASVSACVLFAGASGSQPVDSAIVFNRIRGQSGVLLSRVTRITTSDNTLKGAKQEMQSGTGISITQATDGSLLMYVQGNDMDNFTAGASFTATAGNITRRYTAGTLTNVTTATADTEDNGFTVEDF